jgi:hypothetical protein
VTTDELLRVLAADLADHKTAAAARVALADLLEEEGRSGEAGVNRPQTGKSGFSVSLRAVAAGVRNGGKAAAGHLRTALTGE